MDDTIQVQPDGKTKRVISELHGAAKILEALVADEKQTPKSTLPGFILALAIVQREVAEMRAQMAGAVYRCAAKAGHDISNLSSIYTGVGKDGTATIEIKPADLVEQAESASAD